MNNRNMAFLTCALFFSVSTFAQDKHAITSISTMNNGKPSLLLKLPASAHIEVSADKQSESKQGKINFQGNVLLDAVLENGDMITLKANEIELVRFK